MLTRESVNKLDTLSKLLHKNNLKLESSQLRSLMIKNSNIGENNLDLWMQCKSELDKPDEEQVTSIIGDYIIGVLNIQKRAKQIEEHGDVNEDDFKNVLLDLEESGASYDTMRQLGEGTEAGFKDNYIKKFSSFYENDLLPYGVSYHLLKESEIHKYNNSNEIFASSGFSPGNVNIDSAVKNAFLDAKVFKILNKFKSEYTQDDFNNARRLLVMSMNNHSIIEKSAAKIYSKRSPYIEKTAEWSFGDVGGSIGGFVSEVVEDVGDAIEWTAEKTVEYGSRMINDIVDHGAEFMSALGDIIGDWAKNNPVIAGIIATASIVWRRILLDLLPVVGMFYGFVMGMKNIYYGWKAVKGIAEEENAVQFGLNTTISSASDFFNPSNAMNIHTKLEGILRSDRVTREIDESEVPYGFDMDEYEEPLTGDPEKLISFIRICKLSRIFVTEMLGAPFHFLLAVLDYISIMIWGSRILSIAAPPMAPLVIFVTLLLELVVNAAVLFVTHYVISDKKEEFNPLFATLHDICDNNIHRIMHSNMDETLSREISQYHREWVIALSTSLHERGQSPQQIEREVLDFITIERDGGNPITEEQESELIELALSSSSLLSERDSFLTQEQGLQIAQPISAQ